MATMLSRSVSVDAFCVTQVCHADNALPEALYPNARRAAALYDGIVDLLGACLLTSGYRSRAVNIIIGGNPASAHMQARAVDFVPQHMGAAKAVATIAEAMRQGSLPVDKVLMESARGRVWVHAQVAKDGRAPRKLAYMTFDGVAFEPFNPGDPRLANLA